MRVYLDFNATAPMSPAAQAAVLDAMENYGNPSSVHAEGRRARALVEDARRRVAALAGANPRDVTFAGSGTEAANLALNGTLAAPGREPPRRLILGASEHACVLAGHRFPPEATEIARVGPDGQIDLDDLRRRLDGPPALVAIQAANNETGVLQPIAVIADLVREAGGLLVCDAAQAAGRIALGEAAGAADALLLSAHKFGGPKGVGALVGLREGLVVNPSLRGGGQERGKRAGTENVASLAGFGAAAEAASASLPAETARLASLRDAMEARLLALAPDATIFGAEAPRLPNTLAFAVPGLSASSLLMRLDLEGVAVSSGSACSSGKVAPSHVLAAMGVAPEIAAGAIRVSVGWASAPPDVVGFAAAMDRALSGLRRRARRPS